MAGNVGTNPIAALTAQAQTLGAQAGVNVGPALASLTGGGATPGAAGTPALNAASTTTAPLTQAAGVTLDGRPVVVVKDPTNGKYALTPATGKDEQVTLSDGKKMLFDREGKVVRNFEIAARQPIRVELDQRVGIASGISNLSRIVAQRQERLKSLQEAMAQDSNETGGTNQIDIQQLVQEQQVSENINGLNKKIYDSVQSAVQAWLR